MAKDKTRPKRTAETSDGGWIDAIAAQAGVDPQVVARVHREHGIEAAGTLPRTRKLAIRRVSFSGAKHDASDGERFEFEWKDLGAGLWAVLTDGNSRGKSSILKLLLAVLQGRLPGNIKEDVWGWIDRIDVSFDIDGVPFAVGVRKDVGATKPTEATARVVRGNRPGEAVLHDGAADAAFERAMSDVFMEELGFAKFRAYRSETDAASEHGWPAMSSALFIDGPGKAIFGGVASDGLPIRLMQLFIGMPWISTFSAASTALKSVTADTQASREAAERSVSEAATRRAELELELAEWKQKLEALPDRGVLRAELDAADGRLVAASARFAAANDASEEADRRENDAANALSSVKATLQQARDEAAAGYVFRRLRPSCCPACEAAVDRGRFEAADAETCGLCGKVEPPGDGSSETIPALEEAVADAASAHRSVRRSAEVARNELTAANEERVQISEAAEAKRKELSSAPDDLAVRNGMAAVEARLDELARTVAAAASKGRFGEHDLAVLKATAKLTESKFKPLQEEVLKAVSDAMLRLSDDFGVRNLKSMRLSGNGRLYVGQGGSNIFFGDLTSGEQVRVRIAAALAVLDVAADRGFGRHPGLLILDSPGAQEMSHEDFAALIGAVAKATVDYPDLQVVLGAVSRPEIEAHVPAEFRKQVRGAAELF